MQTTPALAPSTTRRVTMLAERIDLQAAELTAVGRSLDDPGIAAALLAASANLRATFARLNADLMLRLQQPERTPLVPDTSLLVIGQLRIDRVTRTTWLHDTAVPLSHKEYDLVCVLAGEPYRCFTKQELYRAAWGCDLTATSTRTLDSHLCRLRAKLGGRPWVANRWGTGYSLLPATPQLAEVAA